MGTFTVQISEVRSNNSRRRCRKFLYCPLIAGRKGDGRYRSGRWVSQLLLTAVRLVENLRTVLYFYTRGNKFLLKFRDVGLFLELIKMQEQER